MMKTTQATELSGKSIDASVSRKGTFRPPENEEKHTFLNRVIEPLGDQAKFLKRQLNDPRGEVSKRFKRIAAKQTI